eukprot:1298160-Prymnesium_polylepis.1
MPSSSGEWTAMEEARCTTPALAVKARWSSGCRARAGWSCGPQGRRSSSREHVRAARGGAWGAALANWGREGKRSHRESWSR